MVVNYSVHIAHHYDGSIALWRALQRALVVVCDAHSGFYLHHLGSRKNLPNRNSHVWEATNMARNVSLVEVLSWLRISIFATSEHPT